MRKIMIEAVSAFEESKQFNKGNRIVHVFEGYTYLTLHMTKLVRRDNKSGQVQIYIPSSFMTNTTRDTMSAFCSISFAKGNVTVNGVPYPTDCWVDI